MKPYEEDLKELNISDEEFNNIISHIYDKTAEEMVALAKTIKNGARVLPACLNPDNRKILEHGGIRA